MKPRLANPTQPVCRTLHRRAIDEEGGLQIWTPDTGMRKLLEPQQQQSRLGHPYHESQTAQDWRDTPPGRPPTQRKSTCHQSESLRRDASEAFS